MTVVQNNNTENAYKYVKNLCDIYLTTMYTLVVNKKYTICKRQTF